MKQNTRQTKISQKEIRDLLFLQCGGRCPECGRKMQNKNKQEKATYMTVDHIIPKSRGGRKNLENLRPLCRKCNMSRGNKAIPGLMYYSDIHGNRIVLG